MTRQEFDLAKLPKAEGAIIDAEKLYGYLLSPTHPLGRFKATFFRSLGYSAQNWEVFERQLRDLVLRWDVTKTEETEHGQKFVVEGPLIGPSGSTAQIVTVWVILRGEMVPRFVTAYPGELQ